MPDTPSLAGDPAILHPCGREVQPVFWLLPGSSPAAEVFPLHFASTGISWASLNQIVCALRFLYGVTLGRDTIPERITYAREPRKLPAVLSDEEVIRFLEAVCQPEGPRRANDGLCGRYAHFGGSVADIDSQRMVKAVIRASSARLKAPERRPAPLTDASPATSVLRKLRPT